MNHLLLCLAPWLCGAPLTALLKKVRVFALLLLVKLASRIWCLIVRPSLGYIFLPYGQVGVGIPGGLEGATQSFYFC